MPRLRPSAITAPTIAAQSARSSSSAHERAVDLDLVERKHLEIAERGVPGAEIVEHDRDAEVLELVQHREVPAFFCSSTVSVISSSQPLGRKAGLASARATISIRSPLAELRGERLTATLRCGGQPAASLHALRRIHSPSGTIRPVSSASMDELVGPDHAELRVAPAHQRFDAVRFLRRDVDHGLVVQLEFVARDRLAQVRSRGRGAPALRLPWRPRRSGSRCGLPTSPGRARGRRGSGARRHRCRRPARSRRRCWCR